MRVHNMAVDQAQDAKLLKFTPLTEQAEQAHEGQVVTDAGMSKIGILGKQLTDIEKALAETRQSTNPPLNIAEFVKDIGEARRLTAAIQADRLRQSPQLKYGENHFAQSPANNESEQVQAGKLINFGTRSTVAQDRTPELGSRAGNVSALASLARGELIEMRRSVGAIREELAVYMRSADPSELRALDQVAQVLNEMDVALRDVLETAQRNGPDKQSRAA